MFFPWDETAEPSPLNLMQEEILGTVIASIDWHAMAVDYLE